MNNEENTQQAEVPFRGFRGILAVCLGNICRSPAAEGILKAMVKKSGKSHEFFIDSAGLLDYHEGSLPDNRTRQSAAKRNYVLDSRSRPVKQEDFKKFDYLLAMDKSVFRSLERMANSEAERKKIYMMTDFLTKHNYDEIPDPYYGGEKGFELVLDLLEDACAGFLKEIN